MSPADWCATISFNSSGVFMAVVLYIFSMRDNLMNRLVVASQIVFIFGAVLLGGNLLNTENEDSKIVVNYVFSLLVGSVFLILTGKINMTLFYEMFTKV
jgi:hypothetical protein